MVQRIAMQKQTKKEKCTKKQIAKKGKALCLYVTLFTIYPSILP